MSFENYFAPLISIGSLLRTNETECGKNSFPKSRDFALRSSWWVKWGELNFTKNNLWNFGEVNFLLIYFRNFDTVLFGKESNFHFERGFLNNQFFFFKYIECFLNYYVSKICKRRILWINILILFCRTRLKHQIQPEKIRWYRIEVSLFCMIRSHFDKMIKCKEAKKRYLYAN